MRFITYIFLSLTVLLVFPSCDNSSRHPDKVKVLDSLMAELSKVETAVNSLDTAAISSVAGALGERFSKIKENKPDTIDRETAVMIEKLLNVKTPFDAYIKKKDSFLKDISYTKEQLRTLSHDLNKNLIVEEKVEEYFAAEQKKSKELIESARLTVSVMQESLSSYDSIRAPIDELVLKLTTARDSSLMAR